MASLSFEMTQKYIRTAKAVGEVAILRAKRPAGTRIA
jgi:hypothetical protein